MPGFHQLIVELERKFPDDWWIKSRRESEDLMPGSFPQVQFYEKALQTLDEESWTILSEKARKTFLEPPSDRGKYQFFNLLNEALAYEYY
jgi:hypothetical protein